MIKSTSPSETRMAEFLMSKTKAFKIVFCITIATVYFSINYKTYGQSSKKDSLFKLTNKGKEDTAMVNNLFVLIDIYRSQGPIDSSIILAEKSLKLSERLKFLRGIGKSYNKLGLANYNTGNYPVAIDFHIKAYQTYRQIKNKIGMAINLSGMGNAYKDQGNFNKALECYLDALKIFEEAKAKTQMAAILFNTGILYTDMKSYDKGRDYCERALKIFKEVDSKLGIANVCLNLGRIYQSQKKSELSLKQFNEALKIYEALGHEEGIATVLGNIGAVYADQKNYIEAEKYIRECAERLGKTGNKPMLARTLLNLGGLYVLQNKNDLGESVLLKGLSVSKEMNDIKNMLTANDDLENLYLSKKDYKKAYSYLKDYNQLKDSIFSMEKEKDLTRKEMNYEFEKKEAIEKANHEKELAVAAADKKRQRLFSWFIAAIAFSIGIISLIIFRSLYITRKQNSKIEEQKQLLEEHQKDIIDSITYAKRIQDAILPPVELIKQKFPESFLLYKPKDIVAGDFYWMEEFDEIVFIAAADCTGHGVPGAMVSMVCSNALTRSVKEFGLRDAGKILDKTKELVLETFEKSSEDVKDGMDISLLAIDKKRGITTWSGANNPLWYIVPAEPGEGTENILNEIKGDKQPVGKTEHVKPFTTQNIQNKKGTQFYLFTDGLADQFGGPNGKKFKYKQFSDLLLEINQNPLHEQAQKIEEAFSKWKGNLEQVDDVCIIGIKI